VHTYILVLFRDSSIISVKMAEEFQCPADIIATYCITDICIGICMLSLSDRMPNYEQARV